MTDTVHFIDSEGDAGTGLLHGNPHDFGGAGHLPGPHPDGHGPFTHDGFLWDAELFMLLGVFAALALITALLLNGPGQALWTRVRTGLAPGPWRARWDEAVARHQATALAFAEFECDLRALLRLPALADVARPATARFVDAFAAANALRTERFPGPEHAQRFVRAVDRAEQGWAAAVDAAELERDPGRGVPARVGRVGFEPTT